MDYYYAEGEVQKGPVPLADLSRAGLRPDSLVWRDGMGDWKRADALPELAHLFRPGQADPAAPVYAPVSPPRPQHAAPYPAPSPYAPAGGPQDPYGGYAPPAPQPPNGMAVGSMVCGIISIPMTCAYGIGIVLAVVAVVLGHLARGKIRRGEAAGDGMALAGLVCGYVSLILGVIFIAFLVIVFVAAASQ